LKRKTALDEIAGNVASLIGAVVLARRICAENFSPEFAVQRFERRLMTGRP
jgi:hypothetical protein